MLNRCFAAFSMTFGGQHSRRSLALFLGIGVLVTAFYLVLLPSAYVGGFSLVALQFLTPGLAAAAAFLGFGLALVLAMNLAAFGKRSRLASGLSFGAMLTSVLPGALCCTSVIPVALATLGAAAPTVLATAGKFQAVFGLYQGAFVGAAIAAIALAIVLAAYNLTSNCTIKA